MNETPTVYGLILAGGSSTRMLQDKATLLYRGKTQLDRTFDLASRHVSRVFVSVRPSQLVEPIRAARPLIVDSVEGAGPLVGIRSAFAAFPDVAWLVLACDLPFLSDAALTQLLAARDPGLLATAYTSVTDGLPEPLCAVWEPGAAAAVTAYLEGGGHCPRKFLIRHPTRLLEPRDRRALDNINTPEEYAQAQSLLSAVDAPTADRTAPMQLTIQYYALLREQAGRSQESLRTWAATPSDVLTELTARYGFTLTRDQMKVAVNNEFSDWSRQLEPGDAIVFIPPVAGG